VQREFIRPAGNGNGSFPFDRRTEESVPVLLHDSVEGSALDRVHPLRGYVAAGIFPALKQRRPEHGVDEGLYRIVELVAVDYTNGFVPVEQVDRHRNDGGIQFRGAATLGMPTDHRVIPMIVGMALWAETSDLISALEGAERVERNCTDFRGGGIDRAAISSGRERRKPTFDRRETGT